MLPYNITETAMAAMNSLEPEVNSCPSKNIMLVERLDVSSKRSPI